MKKVITYGTFDLLHFGHINILRNAKAQGDYLIVALSTDEFNTLKNKKSVMSFAQRKKLLSAIKYVDKIIPESTWEQKKTDIKKYDIDLLVMGDDWEGKFDNLGVETKYLPRTKHISTTLLKKIISNVDDFF